MVLVLVLCICQMISFHFWSIIQFLEYHCVDKLDVVMYWLLHCCQAVLCALLQLGCGSHYTDVIRAVMQNNISRLGHLCLLFFPPVATATPETNS